MVRRRYADEPGLLAKAYDLFDTIWPKLRGMSEAGRPLGLRWDRCSTPFVRFRGDRVVSHVGVLEIPLVLEDRAVTVGGVHAVATHPDHRRRGHMRALLEEALAWCDGRYETLVLGTEQPWLYEPFGFRIVPEHRFDGAIAGGAGTGFRALNRGDPADTALLGRLLDTRAPVSRRLGVRPERDVFLFDTAGMPLPYAEDLDALVVHEVKDGTLRLLDVVAPRLPTLAEVAARVAEPFDRVEVFFAPDGLRAESLAPVPCRLDDFLMVRGPWPVAGPCILPPTARC